MKPFAIAAVAALLAGPATAADGLTATEVQDFIRTSVERMQKQVTAGDWAGIRDWTEQHLAEGAKISSEQTLLIKDGPSMTISITMDADDTGRFAAMMGQTRGAARLIEEYRVEAKVLDVTDLPGDAASAAVVIDESGVLTLPTPPRDSSVPPTKPAQQEKAADGAAETETATADMPEGDAKETGTEAPETSSADKSGDATTGTVFHSRATCNLRLASEGEKVVIEMLACESVSTLG